MRNNLCEQVIAEVQNHFGEIIYKTVIPRSVRLGEAPSHGKADHRIRAERPRRNAYRELAEEFLQRHGQAKS